MAETFEVTKKDGKVVKVGIYSAEELRRKVASNTQEDKSEINEMLKAFGVPPPNLTRFKSPEEKVEVILKSYAAHGVPTNGVVKTATKAAPEAAPAAAPAPQAQPAAAAPAATGSLAARAKAATNGIGADADVMQVLKSIRAELKALSEKVDALQTAQTERLEVDAHQDAAIVQVFEVARETLKFAMETHLIARATGALAAGMSEDDVSACGDDMYGKFLLGTPDIADVSLAEYVQDAEEEDENAEGNE